MISSSALYSLLYEEMIRISHRNEIRQVYLSTNGGWLSLTTNTVFALQEEYRAFKIYDWIINEKYLIDFNFRRKALLLK